LHLHFQNLDNRNTETNLIENNSSSPSLSPVNVPRNWGDELPEIDLQNIVDHVNNQLSHAGFHTSHPANIDNEDELDQIRLRNDYEEPIILSNHYINLSETSQSHPKSILHNRPVAWGWRESPGFRAYSMKQPRRCNKCQAILFVGEKNSLCCRNGSINIPHSPPPPELLRMFQEACHTTTINDLSFEDILHHHLSILHTCFSSV